MRAAASIAAADSTTSAGTTTRKGTSEHISARSSTDCAEAPSSPTETPPWDATILTSRRGWATAIRSWSKACSANTAKVEAKATRPIAAIPAATETMFCSATPSVKKRSG